MRTFRSTQWRGACFALVAVLIATFILCHHGPPVVSSEESIIYDYNVSIVHKAELDSLPEDHWAQYDASVRVRGVRVEAAEKVSTVVYPPANMCTSLYDKSPLALYISPHGFLSGIPYALFPGFYATTANQLMPSMPIGREYADGGGNTPMIGLLVAEVLSHSTPPKEPYGVYVDSTSLSIQTRSSSSSCRRRDFAFNISVSSAQGTTVEYLNLPLSYTAPHHHTNLTAQVQVLANGTIIFRYLSVPYYGEYGRASGKPPPSIGVVWSSTNRVVVLDADDARAGNYSEPLGNITQVAAIRFDPIYDPCASFSAEECTRCSSSSENYSNRLRTSIDIHALLERQHAASAATMTYNSTRCGWCNATRSCMHESRKSSSCPSNEWIDSNTTCTPAKKLERKVRAEAAARTVSISASLSSSSSSAQPQPGKSPKPQVFYSTNVTQGNDWVELDDNNSQVISSRTNFPFILDTSFMFPFFYNPPRFEVPNRRVVSHLFLTDQLHLRVSRTVTCGETWNYCTDGKYAMSILPFTTTVLRDRATTEARIQRLDWNRTAGMDPYCDEARANATSDGCPGGVVVQVKGLRRYYPDSNQTFSYQVYLDANGTVVLRYGPSGDSADFSECDTQSPFAAHPTPFIGLMRNSVADTSSAVVPWEMVSKGTVVTFTPVAGCIDCNSNGECNMTSRECVCMEGFTGEACDECSPGFYGPQCRACRSCDNGGKCDDGIAGTGYCICEAPYSGENCSVRCADPSTALCDGACSLVGGICECGVCTCRSGRGWGGPTCSDWSDPCARYSFDGCPACTQDHGPGNARCLHCMDYRCHVDPTEENIDRSHLKSCSMNTPSDSCYYANQTYIEEDDWQTVMLATMLSTGNAIMIGLIIAIAFLLQRLPHFDEMRVSSLEGVPDFRRPPREREVIRVMRVDLSRIKKGQRVLAIPLKQITLKALYEKQSVERQRQAAEQLRRERERMKAVRLSTTSTTTTTNANNDDDNDGECTTSSQYQLLMDTIASMESLSPVLPLQQRANSAPLFLPDSRMPDLEARLFPEPQTATDPDENDDDENVNLL